MKTNVVLTRKMGEFDVLQRTSDGFFDANALWAQWIKINPSKHGVMEFLDSDKSKEFINELERQSRLSGDADFKAISITKSVMTKNGKTRAKIYVHPYLFIDFAMWLNPAFKYHVLKFVHDQLIHYRNEAGDAYKELTAAIDKVSLKEDIAFNIQHVAMALNFVVYNKHETGIRNLVGEEEKTRDLYELEWDIAKLVNRGFITDINGILDFLREEYKRRYRKS